MRLSLIAERYAKALFELAVEKKQEDAVYDDALQLASACRENRLFVLVLKSPVISEEKKEKILKDIFQKNFHEITMKFLLILARKNREAYIPEIAERIIREYKEYKRILPVVLTTAVPVSEAIRKEAVSIMKQYTDWKIELIQKIDPGIIGGFILNWEDMQYDASIQHQIERLRKGSASINLYKKGF